MSRIIIGLTGNIATGKSAVMKLAAERGALTIDADRVVHELLDGNAEIQAAVSEAFGPSVRRSDGRIDRAALGGLVFGDAEKLATLEHLLHPAVRMEIVRRVSESAAPVVMIEAIKLLEGPLAAVCDQIWVTTCSRRTQLERLRVCRGMDPAAAETRVDAQPPQADKVSRADVVIETEGFLSDTQAQFERAWAGLPVADRSL
jgi:dephospho-CoA kinase